MIKWEEVGHIDFVQDTVQKVYARFYEPQAGLKAITASHFSMQHPWVGVEKSETEIPIKKGSTSLSIKRSQFPVDLTWTSAVRKVQSLILDQGLVDFNLQKQKSFGQGQI